MNTLINSTNELLIALFSNYNLSDESNLIKSLSNLTVTEDRSLLSYWRVHFDSATPEGAS